MAMGDMGGMDGGQYYDGNYDGGMSSDYMPTQSRRRRGSGRIY